jgi:Protein of unknown function (DUF1592)/Protein of unknown function (DUF1588)/Protein of unknown function (DUF1587)/Protein of unknown function (DUF1595)
VSATPRLVCWLVAAALCGCEGEVGGNPAALDGAAGSVAGSGGRPVAAGGGAGGPTEPQGSTMLRRLNRLELANTLGSVTGTAVAAEDLLPPDPEVQGFDTVATALETTPATVDQLMQLASSTAGALGVEGLGACVNPADERGCALERIATFARRTLRRPAMTSELASYAALYDDVQAREGSVVALSAVAERLLASPDFLYRVELGTDVTGKLSEHELAARLAFTFWESPPDVELSELADRGGLSAVLPAQVERLLQDARAKKVFIRFLSGWLRTSDVAGASKDPDTYPAFAALKPQLVSELSGFVSALVDDDAAVSAIVTAPFTLAGPELAAFYGASHPGNGVVKITLPDRPGLLTRAAFLSTFGRARGSSPIRRGSFIRQRLLCLPLGVPPPGADALAPEAVATTTTRDFFTTLTSPPSCQGCHRLLNPLGFALEQYDGVGSFRTQENGVDIDPSAEVTLSGDATRHVSGATELATAIAADPQLVRCLATEWFRSRFGRIETGGDASIIAALESGLGTGQHLFDAARSLGQVPELGYAHFRKEAP